MKFSNKLKIYVRNVAVSARARSPSGGRSECEGGNQGGEREGGAAAVSASGTAIPTRQLCVWFS